MATVAKNRQQLASNRKNENIGVIFKLFCCFRASQKLRLVRKKSLKARFTKLF
jgi:hypothetical protein